MRFGFRFILATSFLLTTTSGFVKIKSMVALNGGMKLFARRAGTGGIHNAAERPPDPKTLLQEEVLQERVKMLADWWTGKRSVLCITGAGLSTESGIPDYRGYRGSYHKGHKPMVHRQFMESEFHRKRYWGRAMVGWSKFDSAQPNQGHFALAELERMGRLGVALEDNPSFYEEEDADEYMFSSGQQTVAIVTQNVDSLHQRAGSKEVIQLHGRGNVVRCMNCGKKRDRSEFHSELEDENQEWLNEALQGYETSADMRPDGDALLKETDYNHVHIPGCPHCKVGFFKPDVVFFGDSVPRNRVALFRESVEAADGLLVVGSSLAVHSAYRHVRAASEKGISTAILNVGETRAEIEGLENILKIEAPAGDTLSSYVDQISAKGLEAPAQLNYS